MDKVTFQQFAAGATGSVDLRGETAQDALRPAVEVLAAQRGVRGEWDDGVYVVKGIWFTIIGSHEIEIPSVAEIFAPAAEAAEPAQLAIAREGGQPYRPPPLRPAANDDLEAAEGLLKQLFPVDVLSPQQQNGPLGLVSRYCPRAVASTRLS